MDELRYWLALYTVPHCGLVGISKLLKTFATPREILLAADAQLLSAGANNALINALRQPDWRSVDRCFHWLDKPKRTILHWNDKNYPLLLREIFSPPPILFVEGELSLLQQSQLAIVGARLPTPTGVEIAYQFASELSEQGFVITSGLATGIDAAAHQGALAALGKTIAVLGSGLDRVYPACHQVLADKILQKNGVLLSEFFPYAPPKAAHFPRRNRIISGLSLGVIVVEAALRSGSLITARYALEQGREVFAVPGSIRSRLSQGCHFLLKEGAILIENYKDVIEGLSFLPKQIRHLIMANEPTLTKANSDLDVSGLDSEDIKLVECLGFETTSVDTLVARTGLGVDKLLARLSVLELQDYISVVPGGYVRKYKDGKKPIDCRVAG